MTDVPLPGAGFVLAIQSLVMCGLLVLVVCFCFAVPGPRVSQAETSVQLAER